MDQASRQASAVLLLLYLPECVPIIYFERVHRSTREVLRRIDFCLCIDLLFSQIHR